MQSTISAEQLLHLHAASAMLIAVLLFLVLAFFIVSLKRKKALLSEQRIVSNYKSDLEKSESRNITLIRDLGIYKSDWKKSENNLSIEKQQTGELRNKLDILSKYGDMPDAFAELEKSKLEAEEQLEESRKLITNATVESNSILKQTRDRADTIVTNANLQAKDITEDSRKLVTKATVESNSILKQTRERADSILTNANLEAKKIAGEAWDAKNQSEEFEKTARAMKNIINGYGDEYLIPNDTLIDDLAEEYSFEEAGRQLKIVRTQTKILIKDGKAADCDYKEAVRRQRSIEFALDAYNGKAETILSKVKVDNYGIMKKKLEDAFQLVNHNGIPFKNARILPRYADLYQSQLKYAIQTKELKKRDREEQQRIKAEMREEERAQREYKKAQQQAEKEEKLILKAVKEAEEQLAKSVDEERLEFQAQLDALMGKLSEAEAKNQRVMSMAQQTKQGHVYVISNIGSFGENVVKVGMTRRLEPLDRVKELGDASVPFSFDVHAIIFSEDAPKLERFLHSKLHDRRLNRVNLRKEFFSVNLIEIKNEIDSLDLKCHWTMKADALEHRESIQLKKQVSGYL